jgi:hypothetical protein
MEMSGKLRPTGKECILYTRQEDGVGVQNSSRLENDVASLVHK